MRCCISRFLTLLLLLVPCLLPAQWSHIGTQRWHLNTPAFQSNVLGISGGYSYDNAVVEGLFRTTDGGQSWTQTQHPALNYPPDDVTWADAQEVWACSGDGILHSTDAGQNWSLNLPGPNFKQLRFRHAQHGYAAWELYPQCRLYRTLDGGSSWNPCAGILLSSIQDFWFTDSLTGLLAVALTGGAQTMDTTLFRTTDGGDTWTGVMSSPVQDEVSCLWFTDALNGYCGTLYGNVYRTTDGGLSWSLSQSLGLPMMAGIQALQFGDAQHGIATTTNGRVFTTADAGLNWVQGTEAMYGNLEYIRYWQGSTVMASSTENSTVLSTDYGQTWSIQQEHCSQDRYHTWFVDAQRGFVMDYHGSFAQHTTDGGTTWSFTDSLHLGTIYDLCMVNPMEGVIAATTIHTTMDGGQSWTAATVPPPFSDVQHLSFPVQDTGYALLRNQFTSRILVRSTDRGHTWGGAQTLTTPYDTRGMAFESVGTGYLLCRNTLHRTTDGGSTWAQVDTTQGNFQFLYLLNPAPGHLWLVTSHAHLHHSTDGGQTWTELSLPATSAYVRCAAASAPGTVYIGYDQGLIHKTTDAGVTWYIQQAPNPFGCRGMYFVNDTLGYIGQAFGTLLRTTNGGGAGILSSPQPEPETAGLILYPNPAGEALNLRLPLQRAAAASLHIYDLQGREVLQQAMHLQPGAPDLRLDIQTLPPGLWLVQIKTGDAVYTARFLRSR